MGCREIWGLKEVFCENLEKIFYLKSSFEKYFGLKFVLRNLDGHKPFLLVFVQVI